MSRLYLIHAPFRSASKHVRLSSYPRRVSISYITNRSTRRQPSANVYRKSERTVATYAPRSDKFPSLDQDSYGLVVPGTATRACPCRAGPVSGRSHGPQCRVWSLQAHISHCFEALIGLDLVRPIANVDWRRSVHRCVRSSRQRQ